MNWEFVIGEYKRAGHHKGLLETVPTYRARALLKKGILYEICSVDQAVVRAAMWQCEERALDDEWASRYMAL
jgi:hypothetical protein